MDYFTRNKLSYYKSVVNNLAAYIVHKNPFKNMKFSVFIVLFVMIVMTSGMESLVCLNASVKDFN